MGIRGVEVAGIGITVLRPTALGLSILGLTVFGLTPGCYLSHRLPGEDIEEDAAVPCTAPAAERTTFDVEILSVTPDDCAVVGYRFQRELDLSGAPVESGCMGPLTEPTADGCGIHFHEHCVGVELDRRLDGTLRGESARGVVTVDERIGYAFRACHRVERWTRAP